MAITVPALDATTDIVDTDMLLVTHSDGTSEKISGIEINKRSKVIIASTTTVTGTPLKTGNPVRIYFTADVTGSDTTTTLQINYNNVNYNVKVPKNGALENYVAFNLGGTPAVYKYLQAYTTLELLYDGTQFVIVGNPVVISGTNFSIYADGLKRVDEVTENGTDLVTSHAIAAAIDKVKDIMGSLPTDAVLHYSFDEVPDYPDGTFVYKKIKDFTSTTDWTNNQSKTVLSIDNGGLKLSSVGSDAYVQIWGTQTDISNISSKLIKIKWHSNQPCTLYLQKLVSPYTRHSIKQETLGNNVYMATDFTPNFDDRQSLFFLFTSASADNYVVIDEIYIGDGSYTTPIIDNANGQNNAINNGGISVQGVSGKGACFFNGKYANVGADFQFTENFSCSIWCRPEDFSANCQILRKQDVITLVIVSGNLIAYLYDSNGNALLNYFTLSDISINQFTHIVIVRNGLSFKYYKNGVLAKTVTLANATIQKNNNILSVGSDLTTVTHTEDDILIFDRALTETEVMALYLNKANTPKYYPPAQLPS